MENLLKNIPDVSLYFQIWVVIAIIYFRKPFKFYKAYIITGIILLLISSTTYIPKLLINSIEKQYNPIDLNQIEASKQYHIHVLGAGSTIDERLPASMNLSSESLTRLVEGIRVYTHLENATLVTSAFAAAGTKSLAQLSKETAISLGVKQEDIEMLETPKSTIQEARAFKEKFGTDKNIIIATSALHMPRAIEIFTDQGLNVMAAPTGYLYKKGSRNRISFPSSNSLEQMNVYHLTVLKQWYYTLIKK